MAFYHTQSEVKLAVGRLLEVAYNTDSGLTTSVLRSAGPVEVKVDHKGNASLRGHGGGLVFNASGALKELGMKLRLAEISMHVDDEGNLEYAATFRFLRAASATTRGRIDVDKLIRSCSGLLCRAARALEGARVARDNQLREALQ